MEIRGERECQACGSRWSYYRTGSVECPDCGSVRSVGVDERTRHTDSATDLDLDDARAAAAADRTREAARSAAESARSYVAARGFIDAGRLERLDDVYLVAGEVRAVAGRIARGLDVSEAEAAHFLALLDGADDGERPPPGSVPASLRDARGVAYASAVADYRREMATWLADATGDPDRDYDAPPDARAAMERLTDHSRRLEALDGDVPPEESERLVEAARELAAYLRDGDADALEAARVRLDALS